MLKMLLGKNATRKLNFFRILEESPSLSERGKLMMDKLEISEYLVEKIIQDLNSDFQEFDIADIFKVHIVEDEIILEESAVATSDYLEELYIKQSYIFGIIEAIFLGEFTSVNDYALDKFISYPIVYRELKRLRKEIGKKEINISKKFQFKGKEIEIRNFLMVLFTKIYKRDYQIYGSWIELGERQIALLEENYRTLFSEKTKMNLKHYLCISKMRLINEQSKVVKDIEKEQQAIFFQEGLDTSPMFFMEEELTLEEYKAEMTVVYSILLSEGYSKSTINKRLRENHKIRSLTENFATEVLKKFRVSIHQLNIEKLFSELDQAHYQICYCSFLGAGIGKRIDVSFFEEAYSEFFNFVRIYVANSKTNKSREVIWNSSIFIFYRYLLLLITYIPPTVFAKPIYLYIDFSLGKLYNEYIEKNMMFLTSLNLIIEKHITENTQLILTDTYLESANLGIDTIVWLEPPRAHDWSVFATKITEIQNETMA